MTLEHSGFKGRRELADLKQPQQTVSTPLSLNERTRTRIEEGDSRMSHFGHPSNVRRAENYSVEISSELICDRHVWTWTVTAVNVAVFHKSGSGFPGGLIRRIPAPIPLPDSVKTTSLLHPLFLTGFVNICGSVIKWILSRELTEIFLATGKERLVYQCLFLCVL